jgi:hypothetical protein
MGLISRNLWKALTNCSLKNAQILRTLNVPFQKKKKEKNNSECYSEKVLLLTWPGLLILALESERRATPKFELTTRSFWGYSKIHLDDLILSKFNYAICNSKLQI